ncbi:Clp amino terminal domain-containing protein, pathogenicity island component [Abditibacterium utsteinense]|uniref:Clp amino terminal domain-containing protein, pathogenicity island component n=1 Tax=Abditibacterium utsteinense TaxID=1960156 RepID=A0A2S8SW24_9BACT|nr:Clp protease N-terminal domain-containing protein [Abditibacterium utsteinense]PQV64993.1 Clp amino terminal domain-containing protein, pathogenicity island component [Abditibacterium utsteinense]
MPASTPLPLSPALQQQWASATEKYGIIGEAHLFIELLEDPGDETLAALLALSGVSREEARLYTQSWIEKEGLDADKKVALSRSASQVVRIASLQAQLDQSPHIETHHLFLACVSHRKGAHLGEVLRPLGLEVGQLRAHLRGLQAQNDGFTPRAQKALEGAQAAMRASFCGRISTAHLLLGVLSDEESAERLQNAGLDLEDLKKRARDSIKNDGEIASPQKRFSPGAKRALERAAREAKGAGHRYIDCGHLLLALLPQGETLREKWLARGRKLDSVDELWTVEEAAIVRGALGNPPQTKLRPSKPKMQRSTSHKLAVFTVLATVFWFALIANLSTGSNSQIIRFLNIVATLVVPFLWLLTFVVVIASLLQSLKK